MLTKRGGNMAKGFGKYGNMQFSTFMTTQMLTMHTVQPYNFMVFYRDFINE